jgi:TolB-like protein/tetratricopeptide (TPR) repeat protein
MPSRQTRRLDSWKAIAEYLGRSVRTVIRWADERGLPIHRIPGGKRHAVFAYSDEIDAWLLSTRCEQETTPSLAAPGSTPDSTLVVSPIDEEPAYSQRPDVFPRIQNPPSLRKSDQATWARHFFSRHLRWILVCVSLFVCLVASMLVLTLRSSHARISANTRKVRIAVLPVQNLTGDRSREVLADALTDELITRLGGLNPQEMGVIARTSSMTYKNTGKTLLQISHELSVDYVLKSDMKGDLNQLRFGVQLIRTQDLSVLWSKDYARATGSLILMEDELGRNIANEIGIQTTHHVSDIKDRALTIHPDSHLDYLQGRYYWNQRTQEGLERGLQYFDQAIKQDPRNARAYSGRADSYNMLVFYGYSASAAGIIKAQESARRALELDPSLAEAHASLAYLKFMWTWEWPSAESEFRRALELDANYVPAHHWFALYLASMGRRAEADQEIHTALTLDPFSSVLQSAAGYIHYFGRDYDVAIQECQTVLARDSRFAVAHSVLGLAFEGKGQFAQAIDEFRKVEELTGGNIAFYKGPLGHAYAMAGNERGARKMLAELNEMAVEGNYASQTSKATIYAGLGEKENALDALERARDQNDASLIWLGVDPRFDSLRRESRFQALLRAQGRLP